MYLRPAWQPVFWESALIEFWTSDGGIAKQVEDVVEQYRLRVAGNDGR